MYLRAADKSDIHAIANLHAASWRHVYRGALSDEYLAGDIMADRVATWTQRLSSPAAGQFVTVAEGNGQLVGFACAFAGSDPEWGTLLDNLHVSLPNQRRGIGAALLHQVARWCMTEDPNQGLYLWVNQSNVTAQHFYASLGTKNVGSDVWNPPDGGIVPTFRYAWRCIRDLLPEG
ncbi:MAG: GNAT family N-acetyltransferase [Gammaproteobacteria bacterium]|nr:GNAT family N-acetyltransferase [Gammaproteobacteria bacterium]